MTSKERQAIWDKSRGHCWYCGGKLPEKGWHADHQEPIERKLQYQRGKGIVTTRECRRPDRECDDNKVPACASCNLQKRTLSVEEFRQAITQMVHSLNQYHTIYSIAKRYGLIEETENPVVFWFEKGKDSCTEQSRRSTRFGARE